MKILKYQKRNIFIDYWAKDTTGSLYAYEKLVSLVNQRNVKTR